MAMCTGIWILDDDTCTCLVDFYKSSKYLQCTVEIHFFTLLTIFEFAALYIHKQSLKREYMPKLFILTH